MTTLKGKIDFALLVSATDANPNGDPLNGNRPRENYEGYGEISDVCIKRKIRNRFQDMGQKIFVQSDDRSDDGYTSLKERAEGCEELNNEIKKKKKADREHFAQIACQEWLDVRTFGQVFKYSRSKETKSLWEYEDLFQSIRQSACHQWMLSVCRLRRVSTVRQEKTARLLIPWEPNIE